MELLITVSGNFALSAGQIATEADLLTIEPPEISVFDCLNGV